MKKLVLAFGSALLLTTLAAPSFASADKAKGHSTSHTHKQSATIPATPAVPATPAIPTVRAAIPATPAIPAQPAKHAKHVKHVKPVKTVKEAHKVPEIDGAGAALALALMGGLVALRRERRQAK